jgi:hypothetical protein
LNLILLTFSLRLSSIVRLDFSKALFSLGSLATSFCQARVSSSNVALSKYLEVYELFMPRSTAIAVCRKLSVAPNAKTNNVLSQVSISWDNDSPKAANIKIEGRNKWVTVIQNASKQPNYS